MKLAAVLRFLTKRRLAKKLAHKKESGGNETDTGSPRGVPPLNIATRESLRSRDGVRSPRPVVVSAGGRMSARSFRSRFMTDRAFGARSTRGGLPIEAHRPLTVRGVPRLSVTPGEDMAPTRSRLAHAAVRAGVNASSLNTGRHQRSTSSQTARAVATAKQSKQWQDQQTKLQPRQKKPVWKY